MAKGFGTGLIHGGLASAAALLALALVVPLPEGAPVQPEAAAEAVLPEEPVESTPAPEAPSARPFASRALRLASRAALAFAPARMLSVSTTSEKPIAV